MIGRLKLSKADVRAHLDELRVDRHVNRYLKMRPYCWGTVIDCYAGYGYGSYIIQRNPDVSKVVGIDHEEEAVAFARENFTSHKTEFLQYELGQEMDVISVRADVLLSLDTLQTLYNPRDMYALAVYCNVSEIIVSIPTRKTTHYNPDHALDLLPSDIAKVFAPHFVVYNVVDTEYQSAMVFLHRSGRDVVHNTRVYTL